MLRLSGPDSFFLSSETSAMHMHTAGLVTLDPTGVPGFGPDSIRAVLEERLSLVPEFRRRLHEVPLGLDRPVWVDDDVFDLDAHFRVIGCPSPGGPRELGRVVGTIMGIQLDRRRPLWECWYIEGLADGDVAMFFKTHHALVDGVSGAGLAEVMCDLEPQPAPRGRPENAAPERPPSDIGLLVRGVGSTLGMPVRMARLGRQLAGQGLEVLRFSGRARSVVSPIKSSPATPFNGSVSPARDFANASVSLDAIKHLRKECGVKVNDIVLALTASALRRYLLGLDALPAQPVLAFVPVSTRGDDDTVGLGNRTGAMTVALATDVADPLERLGAIHRNTVTAKEMTRAVHARKVMDVSDAAPPALTHLAWRLYVPVLDHRVVGPANLVVANVAGSPIPLYVAGARIESVVPVSALLPGVGVNVTVMSYLDRIDFGFVVDPHLVPDPWALADAIPAALEELEDAVASAS